MDNRILTNALLGSTEVFKFEIESIIQHVIAEVYYITHIQGLTMQKQRKKQSSVYMLNNNININIP